MLTPDEIREALLSLVEGEYEEKQMADIQKEYGDKIKRISLDLLALKYLKEAHIPKLPCMGLVPIALMAVKTSIIGILPKYAQIIMPSRPTDAIA